MIDSNLYFGNKDNDYFTLQTFFIRKILIVSIYKSNLTSIEPVIKKINKILTSTNYHNNKHGLIISGDFNLNILEESNQKRKLLDFMNELNLQFTIPYGRISTDQMTQIDLCLSNLDSDTIQADYFESILSYHKPIWIKFKKL